MATTLGDEIDSLTAARIEAERASPGCFWNDSGRGLTPAEAEVFGIAYADIPRLITVWEAWLDFQGLTMGGPVFHSEEAIAQERARRHELVGAHDLAPFTTFATEVGGLTTRQAEAMFWKDWFWLVREGNVTYPDERGPAQAHAGVSLQHC